MFSKKWVALAGLLVSTTASMSWAATSYTVQTKLATSGGTLKVANKALQTVVGSVVYNNFTTAAAVPVTVTAKDGYTISSVTKTGVKQTITDPALKTFSVDFFKSAGTTQNLIAYFAVQKSTVSTSVASGSGTILPTSALVSYNGTASFTATPTTTSGYVDSITVGGQPYAFTPAAGPIAITVANVTANTTVAVNFKTVSVSAGASKVGAVGSDVTLRGSSTGGTLQWSQVSGPAAVIASPSSAITAITPSAIGSYVFKLDSLVNGTVLASSTVEVTAVADMVAYMDSSCNGCHNPTTGTVPSNSFADWTAGPHNAAGINCVSCHTDGAMPTPVNGSTVNSANLKVTGSSAGTVGNVYCAKCHSGAGHSFAANYSCNSCHASNHNVSVPGFTAEISTNHFDGKYVATAAVDGDGRTEYVTQGATCSDCHNTTNSVIKGFAEGGHGHISQNPLNAFVHYDWSARTNNGTRQNGNCDRCHTAGGFVNFTQQDAVLANRLKPVTGQPNNVLVCVSCHSNIETGALRIDATPAGNPTTLAGGYFALFSSAGATVPAGKSKIEVAFPGYKNSSICIPCHAGRTTDKVFIATIDQSKATLKNYTTISTGFYQHAFNMGQTFIGKGAFSFSGTDYVVLNGHDAVANGATDTQGPCVGCHHSSGAETSHSLHVTGYSSCQSCHAEGFGATDVEEAKAKFDAGVKVLTALIKEKFEPLRTNAALPIETERALVRFGRFGKAAGVAATDATAKSAYGAWYNWHILTNADPGAFVHNPSYARQVLFDTIDYLDGNGASLNGSAEATIAASSALTELEKEEAEAYATPACASCHASQTTAVQAGKHAAEVSTHSGTCGRCHTTEGYVTFGATGQSFAGTYTATYNGGQNVSCSACHDTHGTVRSVNFAPKYAENDAAASKEFKLCTSCHNLVNEAGSVMASGSLVSGTQTVAKQQHYKDWYRNIASTHYDLATTGVGLASTVVEGYNVRFNKESACTDCHGHELYTNTGKALEPASATDAAKGAGTIHTDWAQSGHAGGLLKAKFATFTTANPTRSRNVTNAAAVMAAGVTAESGPAWEHYDWDSASRQDCQKCHTSTGVSNYLDAVAAKNLAGDQAAAVAYDKTKNDFGHLAQWTTAKASKQNEMLYCWGCHKSAETGELRVTGAMTLDYKAATTDTSNIVINAPSKSAVCVSCHAGRGNVVSLMGTTASDPGRALSITTTPKNTASATSTHYLNAAATIFQAQTKVGYQFTGKSYADPVYFKHNTLGCNDCHMSGKSHKFDVVGKDATGAITSLKAANCVTCHTGAHGTALIAGSAEAAAFIEEEAEGYKEALAAFNDALIAKGYIWTPNHPYFMLDYNADGTIDAADKLYKFTDPVSKAVSYSATLPEGATAAQGWTLVAANVGPLWPNEGDLGAAHNYNYLLHEPGAYAHNRLYSKRLIYDSIDWIDNGALDNSVVIPAKYAEAIIWMGASRP